MRSINFFVIYTLFFGLTSLFAVDAIAVSELIIEATEQSADDIVILRHNKSLRLSIIYKDGELIARSDSPIKFIISPASKKYLLFDVKLQKNSKELLMKTRRKYKSYSVVNGEKFTAIKLINQTKPPAEQAPKEATPKNNTSVPQISTDSKSAGLPQTSLETSAQDPITKAIISGNSSNIEITFPFKEQIGGAAFVRNNKVFICFDKSQEVIFPQTTLLAHQPKIYKLEDATLITIALPDKKVSEFIYNQKHWTLSFRSKDSKAKKSYNIQKLDQVSGIAINQNSLQKIIVFKDEEVGDNIAMVTDIASSNSINAPIHFNDFELTKTLSGVAAFWVAEDITTEIKNGVLRIFSPNLAVVDKQSQPKEQAPPEKKEVKESLNETQALNPKSLLPLNYCSSVKGNFSEMKLSLLRALSISDKSNERENALKLSQFFFCYDMIEEALGSANIIQLDTNFLLNNPSFPFYKSVLYSLLDRFEEANEILEVSNSISGDLKKDSGQIAEVDLWTKLNKFYVSSKPISTDALQYIDNILKLYPEEIYWRVIFTELDILSITNDVESANAILQKARLPINNIYGDRLNYYRGTFFRKQNRFNQALNYYNSIKYNPKFPITYIRSQFDATQMLIRNGNINTLDAITNLINLTFLWRGDDLEYDIWMKIVELYYNSQDYLKVLRIYKYILDAFPDNSSRVYISQQMADVYNKQIFSDNGIYNHLTDFQVVSIYYEFRELTPIGEEGDKITLSVASRLIKLDLLDQAEKILDHQIKYRLEGRYKILTADHLAAIYIMNHSPQKALDLLDETDEANYVYNEHLERLRIKAKALLDLAKYQEALESLKLDDSREAKSIKEEACFQMAKWDDFIMLAESSILPYLAQSTNISSAQEKEILRLGIAYSMMGKQQDLQILLGKISDANPLLLDSLKLLLSSGSSINIYELDSRFKINEVDNYFKSVVRRMFNIN